MPKCRRWSADKVAVWIAAPVKWGGAGALHGVARDACTSVDAEVEFCHMVLWSYMRNGQNTFVKIACNLILQPYDPMSDEQMLFSSGSWPKLGHVSSMTIQMRAFKENLQDLPLSPIFLTALDEKMKRTAQQLRQRLIDSLKESTTFDKCILQETDRLKMSQAIESIVVKESSNEAIAMILPGQTRVNLSKRARRVSLDMMMSWQLMNESDLRVSSLLCKALKECGSQSVVGKMRELLYGKHGLNVVNHTQASCLGCFVPTQERFNAGQTQFLPRHAYGFLKLSASQQSCASPLVKPSITYSFDPRSPVQMYRTESKYESGMADYKMFDVVSTVALELPGLYSYLKEKIDLPHSAMARLELDLAHPQLKDLTLSGSLPRLPSGTLTKHLKGACGETRKFFKSHSNSHSRSMFIMSGCFKTVAPTLEDPVQCAFAERRALLTTAQLLLKCNYTVPDEKSGIVSQFDEGATTEFVDVSKLNQQCLSVIAHDDMMEELQRQLQLTKIPGVL